MSRSGRRGAWETQIDAVNGLVESVTQHTSEMARVVAAVSNGDLTQAIDVKGSNGTVGGDFLKYANIVNGMVDQLGEFGAEVTRVAREVGVEGKLGAQATVKGVSGTWKELMDNVNLMADNLTAQVRAITQVVTAVAKGDLKRQINLEAKGEVATLAETINDMIRTLSTFADQVTSVARDVGVEGLLGGQAEVPGAFGI